MEVDWLQRGDGEGQIPVLRTMEVGNDDGSTIQDEMRGSIGASTEIEPWVKIIAGKQRGPRRPTHNPSHSPLVELLSDEIL